MNTGDIALFLIFGGPMLITIVYFLTDSWKKTRIAEQNAVLKKVMIDRGFNADEIVKVLEAGMPLDGTSQDVGSALVDHGYGSDDITAVTNSYDRCPQSLKDGIRSSIVKMIEGGYKGRKIVAYIDSRCAAAAKQYQQPAHA